MTRYYFSLLSVNLLSVKLSLKLHMNIVQNLLPMTVPSLFIRTFKVSSSFFNLDLNSLFSLNFFSCYLFVHILYTVEKKVSLVYHLSELFSSITLSFTISAKIIKYNKYIVYILKFYYNVANVDCFILE